jgi:hypothetical protein
MRERYRLAEEDCVALMDASKPLPLMVIAGKLPLTVEEMVTPIWERIADRLGLDLWSIQPDADAIHFTAEKKTGP